MTSPVGGTSAVALPPLAPAGAAVPGGALLPPPASATTDAGEVITMLLEMSSAISEQQMQMGKTEVDIAEAQRKAAAARRKEALDQAIEAARKAREAAEDGGGLFDFVTDNVGVAGLIGMATFNWGLVAADIAAHKAELTHNESNVFDAGAALLGGPLGYLAMEGAKSLTPEELGGQAALAATVLGGPVGYALERALSKMTPVDLERTVQDIATVKDDDVRLANKIALVVAMAAIAATATVLTGGTSAPAIVALVGIGISTTTQVSAQTGALKEVFGEKAAMHVALGGAITGAALTLGGCGVSLVSGAKVAATTLGKVAKAADAAKTIAEGAFTVRSGLRSLEAADLQYDADMANARAEEQRHVLKRIEQVIDCIIEDLDETRKTAQRSGEVLQGMLQTRNQTLLQAGALKA